MSSSRRFDRVVVVSAVTQLAGVFLPFFIYRETRVSSGIGYTIWDEPGAWASVLIGALIILTFLASSDRVHTAVADRTGLSGNKAYMVRQMTVAVLGIGSITATLLLCGGWASRLVPDGAPHARVSVGAGAWVILIGGYITVLAALKRLSGNRTATRAVAGALGALVLVLLLSGYFSDLSILREYQARSDRFHQELGNHLILSAASVAIAVIVGVPLGVLAYRSSLLRTPVFALVNAVQTIPSLALFGLMIIPLTALSNSIPFLRELGIRGIGTAPALIALSVYALLPVTRNTFTSLDILNRDLLEAGRGVGMSGWQLLRIIELPLAFPVVMGGIRTAMVQTIGNTTVAALIGAGGFGVLVFQGLGQAVSDLILLGAIPVVVLAVAVDRLFGAFVRLITPKGVRSASEERAS